MRAQGHARQFVAGGGVVMAQSSVGPTGDEERFSVGMEEDTVRPAAGLDALDHHSRLRIEDHHGIVIQVRGVEQAAVGRERHIADHVVPADFIQRWHGEGSRGREGAIREGKFEDRGLRSAAHIDEVPARGEGEAQPGIGHRHAAFHRAGGRFDHGNGRRPVSAIEHQQIMSIGRERGGHGEGVERHLLADGVEDPAAIE